MILKRTRIPVFSIQNGSLHPPTWNRKGIRGIYVSVSGDGQSFSLWVKCLAYCLSYMIGFARVNRPRTFSWSQLTDECVFLGKFQADASIFIMCVMSLAVFDISAPIVDGAVLKIVEAQTSGIVRCIQGFEFYAWQCACWALSFGSHPEPFECVIRPRSDKALTLIHGDS